MLRSGIARLVKVVGLLSAVTFALLAPAGVAQADGVPVVVPAVVNDMGWQ